MAWRSLLPGRNRTAVGQAGGGGSTALGGAETLPGSPAVFGKLPDRPDFVRLGGGSAGFERWLEEGLEIVAGKGGGFVTTPVQFLANGGEAGNAWSGVLVPSADAVGRTFPLALFRAVAGIGGGTLFERWQEQQRFFAHAEVALTRRPSSEGLAAVLAAWDDNVSLPGENLASVAARADGAAVDSAALAAELEDVAALAARALADLAREETPTITPRPRIDEDTAPLPVLPGTSREDSVEDSAENSVNGLAGERLVPAVGERIDGATADSLATTSARAAFERAFGSPAASEYALSTFLAACDAARGASRKSITVEAPAAAPVLALFWIALATRRLAGTSLGPSLLVLPDRLVFELVDGPATPALLVAACLGIKSGPRHWTLRSDGAAAAALPAPFKVVLQSSSATLLELLEAVP
jgi:type VI secretion system ImpM family protein